jgi:hypothetical protein
VVHVLRSYDQCQHEADGRSNQNVSEQMPPDLEDLALKSVSPGMRTIIPSSVVRTLKGSTITIQARSLPKETQVRAYNFARKDPVQ